MAKARFLSIVRSIVVLSIVILLSSCGGGGGGGGSASPESNDTDSISSTIGTSGGSITTPSGAVTLNVPSGALSSQTSINISISTQETPPGNLAGVYDFTPNGQTFSAAVTISLKYDPDSIPEGVNPSDLRLAYLSDNGGWEIISNSTVDTTNHIISGQTNHFSTYSAVSNNKIPFGQDIPGGGFHSVIAISNGDPNYFSHKDNKDTTNNYDTGMTWQCVEYVDRYYWEVYGKQITEPACDAKYYFTKAGDKGLTPYSNKGSEPPQPGDILVSDYGTYGHVAIVREVTENKVYVIHQNFLENESDNNYAISYDKNKNYVSPFNHDGRYSVVGWLRLPGNSSPLVASISSPSSNITINTGQSANFQSSISGGTAPYTYKWTITGGSPSSSSVQNPGNVTFNTAGTYTVSLQVSDSGNQTSGASVVVTVKTPPPPALVVNITSPSGTVTINPHQSVTFQGSASGGSGSYTYLWTIAGSGIANSTLQNPGSITFNSSGSYTVVFNVTDSLGTTASKSVVVNVNAVKPLVVGITSPTGNISITVGQSVNFQGSVTGGLAPFTYSWTFGGAASNSSVQNPGNVTFTKAGTYTVNFQVSDSYNQVSGASVKITVNYPPLVAGITSPSGNVTINQGQSVSFQGSASGGSGSYTYLWNFNGGATNSNAQSPGSVTFNTPGTYTVTFTVTDSAAGSTKSTSVVVTVKDIPPTVISTSPANGFTGVATNSTISATFSKNIDSSTVTASTFAVTMGTGGVSVPGALSASGSTVTFTPTSSLRNGTTYTAKVTTGIKDSLGTALASNYTWSFTTGSQGSGMWTWVSGSNTADQSGVYGTKGVASGTNIPGGRYGSISWADSNGNLWLFGGYTGLGSSFFNDLWKFDGTNWTWVSGASTAGQPGVYGTKGVASGTNIPGGRYRSVSWKDSSGNLWLFGGAGIDSAGNGDLLNDLWKFDGTNWTWVSGASTASQPGVYGTQGVAAGTNIPGARYGSISWKDSSGNLWLFGGYTGLGSSFFNDLWKFDGTNWTWVSGASTAGQPGVYGTKGVASGTNIPGGRYGSISWADSNGNLWLFGGAGIDSAGNGDLLNDLWKFDGTNWTWVSGASTASQPGVYGTQGVAAGTNIPGARYGSISWKDSSGNLWLFGGYTGLGSSFFNDLWKFDGTNWTWVSGASTAGQPGVYGTKGVASGTNIPGGRYGSISWADSNGNLWLFGGAGIDSAGNDDLLNDLWKFEP